MITSNQNMKNALVIGSSGTLGSAIKEQLSSVYNVVEINQSNCDYADSSLNSKRVELSEIGDFSIIVCCIGTLHNDIVEPEKRLSDITAEKLAEYYRINAILPALCLKHFASLLDRKERSKFAFLSAMVGSIADNRLGGWYGYRSSKSALNMLIKTGSVEVGRFNKQASLVAIHPGTTQGPLSKPFAGNVADDKYYTPQQSAERIVSVIESLTASQTGSFLNWDGTSIPW